MNHPLQIPLFGFISLRGEASLQDEPQHTLMGQITGALLTQMQIEWACLSDDLNTASKQIKMAEKSLQANKSVFFIVKQNTFQEVQLKSKPLHAHYDTTHIAQKHVGSHPKRHDVLKCLLEHRQANTLLLANAGGTSQELAQLDTSGEYFSLVGAAGCVSSLGLGLALSNSDHNFIAIDGDGGLLMRLGSLTTNAFYHPPNLLHILLNNGMYESTGGQSTVAQAIDFSLLAAAVKTPRSVYAHSLAELKQVILSWQEAPTYTFVHMHIAPGIPLSSPRPAPTPLENKLNFMSIMRKAVTNQPTLATTTVA